MGSPNPRGKHSYVAPCTVGLQNARLQGLKAVTSLITQQADCFICGKVFKIYGF